MATLWALTGSLDARPTSDLKVADVVNDNSKLAKVTLHGFINDLPFVVTRTKTASRGGDLTFIINDEDLTTQSVKETQAILEDKLGVNTIPNDTCPRRHRSSVFLLMFNEDTSQLNTLRKAKVNHSKLEKHSEWDRTKHYTPLLPVLC